MQGNTQTLLNEVQRLRQQLEEQQRLLNEKEQVNSELSHKVVYLESILAQFNREKWSRKAEPFPEHPKLFDEPEADEYDKAKHPEKDKAKKSGKGRGKRKPIPAKYPRNRLEYDLAPSEKICACGKDLVKVGEDVSERLEVIPAKVEVSQHVRFKYACPCCKDGVKTAKGKKHLIPQGLASSSLVAYVATSKYADGLPLHRQESILKRMDLDLSRGTLSRWMITLGQNAQALSNLILDHVFSGPVVHLDETTVQVLKEKGRKAENKSYMWCAARGDPGQRAVYFEYAPTRSAKIAKRLIADFDGYVVTDDYVSYTAAMRGNEAKHCACWDHARRYFYKAWEESKKDPTSLAAFALHWIQALYRIERDYQDKGEQALQRARHLYAQNILTHLREWSTRVIDTVPQKSLIGVALRYMNKNWLKLCRYLEDPKIPMSNALAENAIRPFVVGRKAWLFCDTPNGADASANIYTLIETAKANNIEPYRYLIKVIDELPYCSSVEDYEKLLPWNL